MDIIDVVLKHWGIILSFAGFVGFVVRLTMDSKYLKREEIHPLKTTINDNAHRVDKVEMELKNLPNATDLAELRVLIMQMTGKSEAIATEVRGLSHQVQLLLEKELKNG
ncbi:DUF2730 family protein [Pasteurellaceae bacterium HPA106]|uniref:DUF2730 family protein n=1 Tax=Spirabiliibacterium pneumoniae TaxID=221400 RepID=UPI001AACF7C0|nr:DUF2730 family protein [Spirabiliibacterium pneumoniae]MBE2896753.1 DUF2730 family protein [Spirabiliibacterium pneumoniae]